MSIKLQKGSEVYEAAEVEVHADYAIITWGPYQSIMTREKWDEYTIVNDKSADELNEKPH